MSGKYDDIIDLPHPTSQNHPRMSLHDRAAQFSPFAALTGHHAAKLQIRPQRPGGAHPDDVFSYPVLMPEFFVDIDTREDYAHENV